MAPDPWKSITMVSTVGEVSMTWLCSPMPGALFSMCVRPTRAQPFPLSCRLHKPQWLLHCLPQLCHPWPRSPEDNEHASQATDSMASAYLRCFSPTLSLRQSCPGSPIDAFYFYHLSEVKVCQSLDVATRYTSSVWALRSAGEALSLWPPSWALRVTLTCLPRRLWGLSWLVVPRHGAGEMGSKRPCPEDLEDSPLASFSAG